MGDVGFLVVREIARWGFIFEFLDDTAFEGVVLFDRLHLGFKICVLGNQLFELLVYKSVIKSPRLENFIDTVKNVRFSE